MIPGMYEVVNTAQRAAQHVRAQYRTARQGAALHGAALLSSAAVRY